MPDVMTRSRTINCPECGEAAGVYIIERVTFEPETKDWIIDEEVGCSNLECGMSEMSRPHNFTTRKRIPPDWIMLRTVLVFEGEEHELKQLT